MNNHQQNQHGTAKAGSEPTFRSSVVARMANMPVATLRIWEQRYQAIQPATADTGRRLYSPADVQRVLLLRQLTEQGHAIGSIARLDAAQLRALAAPATVAGSSAAPVQGPTKLRIVVVGPALAMRLRRSAVAAKLNCALQQQAVFETLADATLADANRNADLLLWHAPELRPDDAVSLRAAQAACRAREVAVVYRFSGAAATTALAETGASLFREPADDGSLGVWLASVATGITSRQAVRPPLMQAETNVAPVVTTVAPRRYDDAALTAIAGMSPTLACECPRHVAELLMQLSSFETYSAGCRNRDTADAALHGYLQQVAGAARTLFEAALERVARHEGLPLR